MFFIDTSMHQLLIFGISETLFDIQLMSFRIKKIHFDSSQSMHINNLKHLRHLVRSEQNK